VLETVVYYKTGQGDAMRSFYGDVLGLRSVTDSPDAYRLGSQVFLLFNSDESVEQDFPPAHGASGSVHSCFVTDPPSYDAWKDHLDERGIDIVREITWKSEIKSFYFFDPAGNLLEIANGDMWPR
jgi:catechol 2,3-dioxygenase-like lactoylglutathione lyase family enzyme